MMLNDKLRFISEECLKRKPLPESEERFLHCVATIAIERGYKFNKEGYPASELQHIFSAGERTELMNIYRSHVRIREKGHSESGGIASLEGSLTAGRSLKPKPSPMGDESGQTAASLSQESFQNITPSLGNAPKENEEQSQNVSQTASMPNPKTLAIFALLFIVALIVLAVLFPEPSPFQYEVFRIVLALSAAGVAASIPGILEIKMTAGIKATGAIAVFIIVYFFSPAQLITKMPEENKNVTPPQKSIKQTNTPTPTLEPIVQPLSQ